MSTAHTTINILEPQHHYQHSRITILLTWLQLTAVRLGFTLVAVVCAMIYTTYRNIIYYTRLVLQCGRQYKWHDIHVVDSSVVLGNESNAYSVCIIGGGLSGICMALQCKINNIETFVLFESNSNVGGTWSSNQWQNSECDIQSILYSYSFITDYIWSAQYSTYHEICDYIQHCIDKYDVQSNIQCRTTVTHCHWCNELNLYQVHTMNQHNITNIIYCKYVVNAIGVLRQPSIPHIIDSDRYLGQSFHSARYDHTLDLTNKRVAIIGSGASAISIITGIQHYVNKLYLFQRTAQYVVPRLQYNFSTLRQFIYYYIPWIQKLVRTIQYYFNDSIVLGSRYQSLNINQSLQLLSIDYMYTQTYNNILLQQKLIPNYTIGCKRILLSDTYYNTIQQPNVQLVTDNVKQFTSNSIITNNNNQYDIDVVIYCTGFNVHYNNIKITGVDTINTNELYCSMYRGCTQLYRPNMFHIMGYNTVVSHNSTVTQIESACHYIINALKYCNQHNIKSLQVKSDVVQQYNRYIQTELSHTVFSGDSDCISWFMSSTNNQRINTASWPLFSYNYYLMMQNFDHISYDYII